MGKLLFLVLLNALLRFTCLSYHTLPNMEKQATIHVILKIVCKSNRTKYSTYSRQNVPMFDSLNEMKEYLLENFAVELSPVDNEQSFKLGYIAGRNRRVVIMNDSNLAEAYSMAKDGWVTLWAEATDSPAESHSKGTKRARSDASDDDHGTNVFYLKNVFISFPKYFYGLIFMCVAPTSSSAADMGSIVQLLREKHGGDYAEFKLKVWAKMLVSAC